MREQLPMLLLGVVGGLLGAAFVELNARLLTWRKAKLAPYGRRGKVNYTADFAYGWPCQACFVGAAGGVVACDAGRAWCTVLYSCASAAVMSQCWGPEGPESECRCGCHSL